MSYVKSQMPRMSRAKAMKIYQSRRARGLETTMMDAEPVRAHIHRLHGWGLPINSIARLAGMGQSRVHDIKNGAGERVELRTGLAIMSVSYRPIPGPGMVLSVGAVRRVRALHAIGWSQRRLDVELGLPNTYTNRIQGATICTFETWEKVRRGYERLSMTPGGEVRSANRARKMGWPGPLDWESVDIDDPDAVPASDRVTGSVAGERVALALDLLKRGVPRGEVAKRLGVSVRTVERWRKGGEV